MRTEKEKLQEAKEAVVEANAVESINEAVTKFDAAAEDYGAFLDQAQSVVELCRVLKLSSCWPVCEDPMTL